MDISCTVTWSPTTVRQICTHIVYNAISTKSIVNLNYKLQQNNPQQWSIITREMIAHQMSWIFSCLQHNCCLPEDSWIVSSLFDNDTSYLQSLIDTVFHIRDQVYNAVSKTPAKKQKNGHSNETVVSISIGRLFPPSGVFEDIFSEHKTKNNFLIRKEQRPPQPSLAPAAPSVSDGQNNDAERHRVQQLLHKELIQSASANKISIPLINLQVQGFLNPNAMPRPNISMVRKHFWNIEFDTFESCKNVMGTIFCAVAIQYNVFIQNHSSRTAEELRSVRIGHICKVFRHYSKIHSMLCKSVADRHKTTVSSIKLRYNQLIANFRMYLRSKFPKGWTQQ